MNHDGRRRRSTRWQHRLERVRTASTRQIWGGIVSVVVLAAPFLWLSAAFLTTQVVVAARGVETDAIVVERNGVRRGPDELVVWLLDGKNTETTISHWPPGTDVRDTIRVAYDPLNPGRAVASDAPWVDAPIAVVALVDLGVITLLVLVIPVSAVTLAERWKASARLRERDSLPVRWQGASRAVLRRIGQRERVPGKVLGFFVFLQLISVALGAMVVVPALDDLTALDTRGKPGTAVVDGSEWDDGVAKALHVTILGEDRQVVISRWAGAPRKGDVIDVVYDPNDPSVVQQKDVHPWGRDQRLLIILLAGCVVGTTFVVVAAILGMVRARARPGVRRSGAAA